MGLRASSLQAGILGRSGVFRGGIIGVSSPDFIMTVKTDNVGTSGTDQFTVPAQINGSYNCTVDWGDGNEDTITTYNDAAWTHTFTGGAGTYTITISGQFGGMRFNSGGDRLKLLTIDNWGDTTLDAFIANGFAGCSNLVLNATDKPTLNPNSSNLANLFLNCTSLTSGVSGWDMTNVTNVNSMFFNCSSFNESLDTWTNTGSITNMSYMLEGCTIFNGNVPQDTGAVTTFERFLRNADAFDNTSIGTMDITAATTMTNFMAIATGLSTATYDQVLQDWDAQAVNNSISIDMGGSTYSSGGAGETARTNLINDHTWTIADGGAV